VPDRVIGHLELLGGDTGAVRRHPLQHSLADATPRDQRRRRRGIVVCALLHDIGVRWASWNHPDVSAAILTPFVSEANHWMVEKPRHFQG